jgi:hypothetical protein
MGCASVCVCLCEYVCVRARVRVRVLERSSAMGGECCRSAGRLDACFGAVAEGTLAARARTARRLERLVVVAAVVVWMILASTLFAVTALSRLVWIGRLFARQSSVAMKVEAPAKLRKQLNKMYVASAVLQAG